MKLKRKSKKPFTCAQKNKGNKVSPQNTTGRRKIPVLLLTSHWKGRRGGQKKKQTSKRGRDDL